MPSPTGDADLVSAIIDYSRRWPDESAPRWFLELLATPDDPFVRERVEGHITASAWLVSADRQRLLMTHHRKLGLWLQLGGHVDGERDLMSAALREAREESGLGGLQAEPGLFDLDRHWIPDRPDVPAHWHYDVRFVIHASAGEDFQVSEESHALAWRDIATLADDEAVDASIRRMARKWLARETAGRGAG